MGKWEMVRLGDVAHVTAGQGAPQNVSDYSAIGIPFVKAGNLHELVKGLDEHNIQKVSDEVAKKHKLKLFPKGTVIFAKSGMSCMKGYVHELSCPCYVVNHLACIMLNNGFSRYLKYTLERTKPNILIKDEAYPSIALSDVAAMQIPFPPLIVQKKIADVLDRANTLIEKRKTQIAKLDLLVKSQFVTMFGDPVINPMGWVVKPLQNFATVKIGPFGSLLHAEDYIEGGIPLVNPSHIVDGKIVADSKLTISQEKYDQLLSYALRSGDIVLGRRGEIGRCAVVDDGVYLCGTGSMFIRIESDYLPMVLQKIISSSGVRQILKERAVGITMMNLNAGTVSNLEVIVPPLDLQTQFIVFTERADAHKTLLKKSLALLELNYKSLMQKCFNGAGKFGCQMILTNR